MKNVRAKKFRPSQQGSTTKKQISGLGPSSHEVADLPEMP